MFTQKCFIRKNNAKLFNTLQDLGYKHQQCFIRPYRDLLIVNNGYYSINFPYGSNNEGFIDCGKNEDLFLALAALRDDTDKHQWFIYDSMDAVIESFRVYEWFICNEDKIENMLFYDSLYLNAHKATVEELIEHFSK